ncbi:MAG: HAD family phosphatase [Bacteroidales bacterium]|nr:HAD family phosphatase [Bacteroidales bacterium]
MIKNVVFDYGGVIMDWNPHYLYDPYFGSHEAALKFLEEVCTYEWDREHDAGKPVAQGTAELVAKFPEWEKEIRMYYGCFPQMIKGYVEGTADYALELKSRGYHIYGLSNWSDETFEMIRHEYPVFEQIEGMIISGQEGVVKPDPAIYKLLFERYNLKVEECIFIDDSPVNIEASQRLGMRGIVFENCARLREVLEPILAQNNG